MGEFRINILELARQVFGIGNIGPSVIFNPSTTPEIASVEVIEIDENFPSSVLDTPIIDILKFVDGIDPVTGEKYEGIELIDVPIIDASRAKNIVKTAVQGRNGTVKELIALDDYSIRIRGLLVNHNSYDPPEDDIIRLKNLEEIGAAIDVESELMRILGINALVIQRIDWPTLPGFTNVQPYLLQCLSDEPLELSITELF